MTDADIDTDTDIDDDVTDMSELAELVIDELNPGQTIGDKIVLSRRQLVAIAGGGLSLGALGTFGVSDTQAQSGAVGTIGTSSSPVDVEAATVAAQSVSTGQARIPPEFTSVSGVKWERPEVTKSSTTVQVPQDEPTPQDALRKVPRRLHHEYLIQIDGTQGPYSQDLIIPPVVAEEVGSGSEGTNVNLEIEGQSNRFQVDSLMCLGGRGAAVVKVRDCDVSDVHPFDDEDACYIAYGGGSLTLSNCAIVGSARNSGSVGVMSYTSKVKLEGSFDWGTDLVSVGGETKQLGGLHTGFELTGSGSVTNNSWVANGGPLYHNGAGPTSGTGQFAIDPRRNDSVVSNLVPMVTTDGTEFDALKESGGDFAVATRDGQRILLTASGFVLFRDDTKNGIAQFRPDGNLQMLQDGTGIRVTSPDGTIEKDYGVRNDGTWGELP